MNSQILIIGLIVLIVFGGGAYVLTQKDTNDTEEENVMTEENMEGESMEKDEMMSSDGETMEDEEGEDAMKKEGTYEAYAPEKLVRAESGDVVLFFSAAWCPTCRALDADIRANEAQIPDGVTILKVDYDNATALRQKYGVTYQHTLVQVDADGNQVAKWSSSPTLSALVSEIQ